MSGIGHNRGPSMKLGLGWRRHAWNRARSDLLPKMPIEIVRLRVKRAAELGLDYRAYASIRATSGHDVVALIFSSNALRLIRGKTELPPDRVEKLTTLSRCTRMSLLHKPLSPEKFLSQNNMFDAAAPAPGFRDRWPEIQKIILDLTRTQSLPGDQVVLVGDTAFEREWCAAGKLAGYVSSDSYFGSGETRQITSA